MSLLVLDFAFPFQQPLVEFNLVSVHPALVVVHPLVVELFHLVLAEDSISGHVRVAAQVLDAKRSEAN